MGYWYEVENQETMELSNHLKEGIRHIGKAMSIAEEMCNAGNEMGMRRGYKYGGGGSYGMRGGYRDEEPEYDDYGNPMGMRRMRDSMGRFM